MPESASSAFHDFRCYGGEADFRRLVDEYLPLVWAAALRVVHGDAALAQDVSQQVFAALAGKARTLPESTVLGAWLHRVTVYTAAKAVRTESRRRERERQAAALAEPETTMNETALWTDLAPHLDEALDSLPASDREAVILRFHESKSFPAVAAALGISEEAARKRVDRAVEKLRAKFGRKGIALSAIFLAALLTENASATPPVGVASGIASAAWQNGAVAASAGGIASVTAWISRSARPLAVAAVVVSLTAGGLWAIRHLFDTSSGVTVAAPAEAAASSGISAATVARGHFVVDIVQLPKRVAIPVLLLHRHGAEDAALLQTWKAAARTDTSVKLTTMEISVESGRRVKYEKFKEFPYPTDFDYDESAKRIIETTIETRNVGSTMEIDPIISDGGDADVNLAIEHHFAPPRWRDYGGDPSKLLEEKGTGPNQPEFFDIKLTSSTRLHSGETRLITATSFSAADLPADILAEDQEFIFFATATTDLGTHKMERQGAEPLRAELTTFRVPFGLDLNPATPAEEGALFESLREASGSGGVSVESHQILESQSGQRAKIEALHEVSYPTEWWVDENMAPFGQTYEVRNVGTSIEIEGNWESQDDGAAVPQMTNLASFNLAPNLVSLTGFINWSGESAGTFATLKRGDISQPVFGTYRPTTAAKGVGRLPRLLAVSRPPNVWKESPNVLVTFLRCLNEEAISSSPPASDPRISLIAYTVKKDIALSLLWDHAETGDAALEAKLREGCVSGAWVRIVNVSSIAIPQGQRGQLLSISEYPHPSDYEQGQPYQFEFRNLGALLEAESMESGGLAWEMLPSPELVAWDTGHPGQPQIWPEFCPLKIQTSALPNHETRLLGVVLPGSAMEGSPWPPDQVLFVFGRRDSVVADDVALTPTAEEMLALFSMPVEVVEEFRRRVEEGITGDSLLEALKDASADIRCEGLCSIKRVELPGVGGSVIVSEGMHPVGAEFTFNEHAQQPELRFAFTPPLLEPLGKTLDPGNDTKDAPMVALLEKQVGAVTFDAKNLADLKFDGRPHILHAAPVEVDPSHPQHGRWHVVVGKCRRTSP